MEFRSSHFWNVVTIMHGYAGMIGFSWVKNKQILMGCDAKQASWRCPCGILTFGREVFRIYCHDKT
jgi:hypothetical protein